MHDIGRTQLEQQSFGELESGQFEGGEFEGSEFESGEFEGEFEGGGQPAEAESPLSETEEMELASELLEVASQGDLEQFLDDVFQAAGQAVGNFVRSDAGRALGGILSDSLRSAAQQALPVVGRAIGDMAGAGDLGASAGSAAGPLLGLELEGTVRGGPRVRDGPAAGPVRRFRGRRRPRWHPRAYRQPKFARTAASRAARIYAPGLLPRLQGRSTRNWPRGGRWVRRGRTIVLYGF